MPRPDRTPLSKKPARFWIIFKKSLVWSGLFFLTLGVLGFGYQSVSTWRDLRRFPPPGTMVIVGNHRLHAQIRGSGSPTVVFDAVLGASSMGWAPVQPEVEALTTTLAYDRAGYGWSEPGPRPRTSGNMVTELHELLVNTRVPKPYILVGASLGGINARLYAFRYPEDVAGLVLVDPAHEDQFRRMTSSRLPPLLPLRLFQFASRVGLLRLAGMPVDIAGMKVLPGNLQRAADAVGYRTAAVDAIVTETAALEQSFLEIRQAKAGLGKTPLGNRPLIVLTHQEASPPAGAEAADEAVRVGLHQELAAESLAGRQVMVEKSGHFIGVDQPGKVVDAIREVVNALRESRP